MIGGMSALRTPSDRLQSLARCADPESLRCAVRELCTEFGKVLRLEIFTLAEAEKRRAFCLMRLESPEQERRMKAVLGAAWFGDDMLLVVDLPDRQAVSRPQEAM